MTGIKNIEQFMHWNFVTYCYDNCYFVCFGCFAFPRRKFQPRWNPNTL